MVEKLVEKPTTPRIMGAEEPLVVVGIPAYNEEQSIGRVVLQARKFSDLVVVCDDGSSDMTAEISEGLGAIVVRHERNVGYGAAIQSLFRQAKKLNADVLVTVDGDGQHEPSEVPDVAQPILEGSADVVVGSRFASRHGTQGMPFYRRAGVKLITKLVNGSAKNGVSDAQSGFRAYGRRALDLLSVAEDGMGVSVEILLDASKHGLKVCEVSSSCKYESGDSVKKSTHNPIKQLASVLMSIIRYAVEDRPLTMLGVPGAFCLLTGVLFGIWMLQIYA
ncbi:MAG: glycosyltransferase family 2 protein, partial [Candidatus Bathyarchaeota archaeon]|nr:glycosyltransferase family 2 protein [Candidatus Bathyarchaeota archaeon]